MKIRVFVIAAALAACSLVRLPAAPSLMPIEDVKPGMIGTGRTIFEGTELKDFKVHILGVLRNVQAPKRNLILARLEGGPLAQTGVIAGMSGSPVYIDGRLVGAVSYSIGAFPKEPIAGITPIGEMIDATADTGHPGADLGDWHDRSSGAGCGGNQRSEGYRCRSSSNRHICFDAGEGTGGCRQVRQSDKPQSL